MSVYPCEKELGVWASSLVVSPAADGVCARYEEQPSRAYLHEGLPLFVAKLNVVLGALCIVDVNACRLFSNQANAHTPVRLMDWLYNRKHSRDSEGAIWMWNSRRNSHFVSTMTSPEYIPFTSAMSWS
jgi:hypothetical protein